MSKKIALASLGVLLLAGFAAAQIKSVVVPYTPPKKTNNEEHKTAKAQAAVATPADKDNPASAAKATAGAGKTTEAKTAAPSTATTQAAAEAAKPRIGPGEKLDAEGTRRVCDENDPTPAGTVIDGYRKVDRPNVVQPHHCEWEAVK